MTAKIPKHWKIKKLGEIANISSGTTPFRKNPLFYDNADIPWVKTTDLNNSYITTTEEKVSMYALNNTSLRLYPTNTVLVAMYGGFNQIGRTGKLAMEATINQALSALVLKYDDVNSDYLLFWLNANVEKWKRFAGSSRKDPNINGKDVAEFSILIPPLEEQEKIAEILLTCDKAIRLTTQIIPQLKQRNQGLAQQLLTGEKSWKKSVLKNIAKIKKGEQLNVLNLNNKHKYPSYSGGITPSGYTDKYNTEKDTIIISEGGNSCGYINFIKENFWSGGHCYSIVNSSISKDINKMFLFYFLKKNQEEIMRLRVGSGLPNIQKRDIGLFEIEYPPLTEQNAIAQILDTAHQELKLYEQKLQLLQAQKKTLMQKLITGEVLTIK